MSKKKPFVFLDVSIDGDPAEKLVFELFSNVVPKTAENFRALCTGENGLSTITGKPLHYKGTFFHRVIKGSMAQGGDFLRQEGSFGESIYGSKFPDESTKLKHDRPGLLSMAIADRDERGSLFNVIFKANHHLDRKNIVFGKLVLGYDVLKKIEKVGAEDGTPAVTVKIINSGEMHAEKWKLKTLAMRKDASSDASGYELQHNTKHKRRAKDRRKKTRRYASESNTSSDSEIESSETNTDSDSDSDSDISSSTDISSSGDDRQRKHKRYSKRDRYRRRKRRDTKHEKKLKRHDKRSKHRSKRPLDSSGSVSGSESSSDRGDDNIFGMDKHKNPAEINGKLSSDRSDDNIFGMDKKHKNPAEINVRNHYPLVEGSEAASVWPKKEATAILDGKVDVFPREKRDCQVKGLEVDNRSDSRDDRKPEVLDDHPGKSRCRSQSGSPKRTPSKSVSPQRGLSRSRSRSFHESPQGVFQRGKSVSRSPLRSGSNRSPARSFSRSPERGNNGRSFSRTPVRGKKVRSFSPSPAGQSQRSISRSPSLSPRRIYRRSPTRTLSRRLSGKSVSRSPLRSSRRSRSSGKAPLRRSFSKSPARGPTRNNRCSYSRSPESAGHRGRSPNSVRGRSLSRSPSHDGSCRRVRRGRDFSERYSYACRYRSRSPVQLYRYGRSDRGRYSSYRRSPRRYRSSPRARTPPRYRSRSRSSSVPHSPIRYRSQHYSRPPLHSRSPMKSSRYRSSPRAERQRSSLPIRSPSVSRSSNYSPSPKRASVGKSRSSSSSGSPPMKNALVSYEDVSPDSRH